MVRLFLVAGIVLAFDLVTKILVHASLDLHVAPVRVIGEYVRLAHVKNYGSAFGLFQGGRTFFILFSLFSIVVIIALARDRRYRTPGFASSLGMILGGALGNLIDRVSYGSVTDWLDVGVGHHRWPTFNIADVGVTCGVLLLAVLLFRSPERRAPVDEGTDPRKE